MGNAPGQAAQHAAAQPPGQSKVYASVYSGVSEASRQPCRSLRVQVPVFEAMIRGISVMRRTSDSWVNATQILKVAGIPKTARTKILDKEIQTGTHEKVQGGYGKYQGTWIPFERGQELAAQYGVTAYLAPIFDFIPSPSNVAALPINRPEGGNQPNVQGQTSLIRPGPGPGRIMSPYPHGGPLQSQHYQNGNMVMQGHPAMAYSNGMYYPAGGMAHAADMATYGLPPSGSGVYLDAYGQPQSTYATHQAYQATTNGDIHAPPAKRQRSEENMDTGTENGNFEEDREHEQHDDDEESIDELRDAPPLPTAMRLSDKPLRPKTTSASGRMRQRILSLFNTDKVTDVHASLGVEPNEGLPEGVDVDMIIDSHGHTALHWAAALARHDLVSELISIGADIHRGNYAGETPLIRAILTTNHAEADTFSALLELVSPSIRTLDHAYRTVLHHIAHTAGIKGRAAPARKYMAAVLEWVAREQQSQAGLVDEAQDASPALKLKNLVDVQDVHGDTALLIAARVGNRGLITLLLDAGADKTRPNKLGLKAEDFGVELDALKVSGPETIVGNLKSEPPRPEKHSRDVQKNIGAIFENVNETFSSEMQEKQTRLNTIEQNVRHTTRSLAEKRQQLARLKAQLADLEGMDGRIEYLRRALDSVTVEQWTGRSAEPSTPAAFAMVDGPAGPSAAEYAGRADIPIPQTYEEGSAAKLRRLNMWEDRIAQLLQERLGRLDAERESQAGKYRRLVSLCTRVPADKVDEVSVLSSSDTRLGLTDGQMLDSLMGAVETEEQNVDLRRIAGAVSELQGSAA